VTKSKRLP